MRGKPYRDSFVEAHLSTNIAAQIQTLREARGWTQKQLGEKAGMAQNRISVLEDPSYDKFTLSTCRRLASAFDVAFIGRFIAFSELVEWVSDLSPAKLTVPDFEHDALPTVQSVNYGLMAGKANMYTAVSSTGGAMTINSITGQTPYGNSLTTSMSGGTTGGFVVHGQSPDWQTTNLGNQARFSLPPSGVIAA